MRDSKRLTEIRKLPCARCGDLPPSQAAHSNNYVHGKARGRKADDSYTVPLCYNCHSSFDQFKLGNREESEALFLKWLEKTNRLLIESEDLF